MGVEAPELHQIGKSQPKLGFVDPHSQKSKLREKFKKYTQGSYEFAHSETDCNKHECVGIHKVDLDILPTYLNNREENKNFNNPV